MEDILHELSEVEGKPEIPIQRSTMPLIQPSKSLFVADDIVNLEPYGAFNELFTVDDKEITAIESLVHLTVADELPDITLSLLKYKSEFKALPSAAEFDGSPLSKNQQTTALQVNHITKSEMAAFMTSKGYNFAASESETFKHPKTAPIVPASAKELAFEV